MIFDYNLTLGWQTIRITGDVVSTGETNKNSKIICFRYMARGEKLG